MTNDRAPGHYRGRRGRITGVVSAAAECEVKFEDGREPDAGFLRIVWLQL